ncbi:MAG: DNA mismatch repair endonuclease MutL [Pseudobutyrivibrio sp.]|nr:DNA mismatch repair endonuclease MutL [Pseudobutyrivibrio sp.]
MTKINILSQETIDKIAAGEVVERPASVVKELVENAIDANATAITIEIKDGGIEYIRITDNGTGIDKSQIKTAFLRHTTSKINDSHDLFSINSLGFRGEALSSISAVSKVELLTKTREALLGARYTIEGGIEKSLDDIGCPDGTTFIIRQLFYNTPARKKFLKKDATEASYVFDVVEHLALSHSDISFRFIANGKERLMTSGNGVLLDNIYQIYGRQIATNILDINYSCDFMSINGYVGKSVIARGNRSFEQFFVNGRYIKSDRLSRACEEGYYGFLMGHQYPFILLNIRFTDGIVDVNVHPTKQEVRFDNEDIVISTLTKIINERLTRREDILEAVVDEVDKQSDNILISNISEKTPEPFEINKLNRIKSEIVAQIHKDTPYEKKYDRSVVMSDENISTSDVINHVLTKESEIVYEQTSFLTEEARKKHKVIGQVFDTYWIIEHDDAMYIIDQHAAHEKILFERTMKRIKNNEMTTQGICPPIVISLSPTDLNVYHEYKNIFTDFGYEIEDFGGNELIIKGIPGNMLNLDPENLFHEIVDDCSKYKASSSYDAIVEKVASMSCKAAVKGNNRLSLGEINEIIDELLTLENPYHCPHGRPTMISFSEYELGKKFKRII